MSDRGDDEAIPYPPVVCDDLTIDPVYLEMQKTGPVRVQLPYGEPCWVATRYHDVKKVYGDRRFVKGLGAGRDQPRTFPVLEHIDASVLAGMDPPKHTRVRRLASGAFSVPAVRGMAGRIEAQVDRCLDAMLEAGPGADFVDLVARPLPLLLLASVLGIDEAEIPVFEEIVERALNVELSQDEILTAFAELWALVEGLIRVRRERPTDDALTTLVQARDGDDHLTEDELVTLSMTLFFAGFETTAAQLGSTAFTLMTHRRRWEELLAEPDLVPNAVEELWRWIPSFRHGMTMIQWASEDVELSDGVVIPAGDAVLPEHQVANRDESVFPHASEIDFRRADPEPHLSLAWGAHHCLGARLASAEVEAVIVALLRRFPTLELIGAPGDVGWSPSTLLRSPSALHLGW